MRTTEIKELLNEWRTCTSASPSAIENMYLELLEAYVDDKAYFDTWVSELRYTIDRCNF